MVILLLLKIPVSLFHSATRTLLIGSRQPVEREGTSSKRLRYNSYAKPHSKDYPDRTYLRVLPSRQGGGHQRCVS
jgi:hypothetical protein